MKDTTASIVLFNTPISEVVYIIKTFLKAERAKHLYIIDNSQQKTDLSKDIIQDCITYIYNNKNVGYGSAHNKAIKLAINNGSKYHIVLNTDIKFDYAIIDEMATYMDQNQNVGQIMPKIMNVDGTIQYLCKLIPTPQDLITRRFFHKKVRNRRKQEYYLKNADYDKIMNIPNLSGCFMFLRNKVLQQTGLFDPRFFLYMEDVDLTRRIHTKAKTVFYPKVEVIHNAGRGSYRKFRLMITHSISAIKYFNKWGWMRDEQRRVINKIVKSNYLQDQ
ncbi:glycosyltransferase family 2 protein [Halosquirtibacter laminarini]|uniref:Glycosyltransferase family 2 protein n=1 Tax=Halosquirtibacter laminarini TaxID=3374600 RepID=A0AC61NGL3_9BACT|nr:glycosyltransferase family 2 protein [Prolixibacteraceae bacterium]